tara:strand:- start:222 stop:509 length:288 start_codon:yes stop_codon:yes gene_type:complete
MEDEIESVPAVIVDTVPALKALMDAVGNSYRECASIFGTGHTHLWNAINGKRRGPTIDTLVRYASRARDEAGVEMQLLITSDLKLKYKITPISVN